MQAQDKENSDETTEKDFLNELKFQYDRELELRNILDNKVTNLITTSSSIMTISIAIATFLISRIQSIYITIPSLVILGVGILFATRATLYFLNSYSLKTYRFAMGSESFFDDAGKYKEDVAKRFLNARRQTFAEHIAKEYLESINRNMKTNQDKANSIKNGQRSLNWSVLTVSMLVTFVIVVVTLNLTSLTK